MAPPRTLSVSWNDESIPLAMHGLDEGRLVGIVLELAAQAQHVGVHRARGREPLVAPHFVEQSLARDDVALVLDQVDEQVKLLARQAELASRARHPPSAPVDAHRAEGELLELLAPARPA